MLSHLFESGASKLRRAALGHVEGLGDLAVRVSLELAFHYDEPLSVWEVRTGTKKCVPQLEIFDRAMGFLDEIDDRAPVSAFINLDTRVERQRLLRIDPPETFVVERQLTRQVFGDQCSLVPR